MGLMTKNKINEDHIKTPKEQPFEDPENPFLRSDAVFVPYAPIMAKRAAKKKHKAWINKKKF